LPQNGAQWPGIDGALPYPIFLSNMQKTLNVLKNRPKAHFNPLRFRFSARLAGLYGNFAI